MNVDEAGCDDAVGGIDRDARLRGGVSERDDAAAGDPDVAGAAG